MIRLNLKKSTLISTAQIVCLYLMAVFASFAAENQAVQKANTLDARQQAIIPIAAFTAAGNIDELEGALNSGLDKGLSVNEIKEIFIHSYAYVGFPRALNGINAFIRVMDERKQRGINDKLGDEATPVPADYDANAYGNKVRNELVGQDISNRTTGYAGFVPTIDKFLVEHLFADIFYRDVLSVKDRELVTISMLAALPGAEAQLTSHTNLSVRVGYSHKQLLHFMQILNDKVSQDSAIRAMSVVEKITDVSAIASTIKAVEVKQDASFVLGAADKFSGKAKVSSRFTSPVAENYSGAMVEFEAGARTAWHTHPKGQTLIIISGKGLVQSEGGAVQEMLSGNVVTIPPNTKHWHGAASDSAMSHIAISTPENGQTVSWLGFAANTK